MNTKAKRCFRLIAVFLCVSLLLNLSIFSVHAVPDAVEDVLDSATPSQAVDSISPSVSSEEETLQFENAMIYTDQKAGGIREVTELREASVKHFAMTDGSYRAVSYASPVHRKDANGVWQNIDNRLSLQNVKGTEFYATSDQRTMFAKSFTANTPVFLLSENDYMIGMAFVSNQLDASESVTPMGAPTITNAAERVETTYYDTLEEASAIDNRSSITYANIKANTDLEYVLIGNDVKENIVVKSPGTRYEYTFMLGLIGLNATLEASGDIAITDIVTGERKYTIPAPFMYDASGEVSRDVAYTLNTNADGSYTLKITASTAWINAEGRTFPVKIDPSVLVEMPEMDTYMDVNYPEDVNGTSATLTVSSDATAYIKLAMPSLPSDAEITSATLYTKKYSAYGSVYVSARRVTGYWSESTPGAGAPYYSATTLDSATISPYSGTVASFDITSAATAWDSGTANYGIALVGESEYVGDSVLLESMETWTIDGNDDATGSYMIIYYTQYIPDGVYAFESTYDDSDMWLTVKNMSPIAGERMIQRSASPITQETFANACFFKISRVPNTERYIIRLMTNNCLTFGYEDEQIVTKEIPYNDADVSANDCFYIGWNGESYELIPCGNTDIAIAIDYDGSTYITTGTPYSSDSTAGWQLEQYTGNSIDGVTEVAYSDELDFGETYDYDVCMYSSTIGRNGPVIYGVCELDNSSTSRAIINSSTGVLDTYGSGFVKVTWTYSGSPFTWDRVVTIGFEDKIIHTFNNKSNGKLMLPEGTATAAYIKTDSYDYSKTSMMWKFEYAGNGYYKIKNDFTGYYLTAPSNNVNNAKITQAPYNSTYGLWMIRGTSDGYYIIQSKNQYERTTSSPLYLTINSFNNYIVQSTDISNYQWSIDPLIMRMNVLYDDSFVDEYPSYMDLLRAIYSDNSIGNSIVSVFKDRFGIALRVTYTTTIFESFPYTENCIHKASIETMCMDCKNAGSDIDAVECRADLHHKSELSMLGTIPYTLLYNSTYTNILFTAYKGCYGVVTRDEDGNLDTEKTWHNYEPHAHGWAANSCNKIIILAYTYRDNLSNNDFDGIIRTTAHETLHTLGADHCDTSSSCIMNSQSVQVSQNLTICATCCNTVNTNKFWLYRHQ